MRRISDYISNLLELPGPERNRAMEGLRGLAVTLVFFVHYYACFRETLPDAGLGKWLASFLEWTGKAGVDLFFVLSGYLIYGAVMKSRFAFGAFMRRRVQRIYPTFLAVFALYLGLAYLMPSEGKVPAGFVPATAYILKNVLLLPGMLRIPPLITVAWSLSYEFFFYAVLPLFVAAVGLRRHTPAVRVLVLLVLGIAVIAITLLGGGHLQFLMFVCGMLVYESVRALRGQSLSRHLNKIAMATALLSLPIAYALGHAFDGTFPGAGYLFRTLWLALAFGVVAFTSFDPTSTIAKACSRTCLRRLGNMSYSYYLIHGLALKGAALAMRHFVSFPHGALAYWLILPIAFVATLVASTALFATVEKPVSLKSAFVAERTALAGSPAPADGMGA